MIERQFGTVRGLVRLGLSYAESVPGLSPATKPVPASVNRLVFVCHGNICRSAFAEAVAQRLGLASASFGLSTSTGKPAHPPASEAANLLGFDLTDHRTTNAPDFIPQDGDYLLGMEMRHLRKLAANDRLNHLPRGLLGAYARPPFPHLHDPYKLEPAYMNVCLERVQSAVERLAVNYPAATAS